MFYQMHTPSGFQNIYSISFYVEWSQRKYNFCETTPEMATSTHSLFFEIEIV